MFNYAKIDEQGYCIGLSTLSGEVIADDMILLAEDEQVEFGQKYDVVKKVWTQEFKEEEPVEVPVSSDTLIQRQLTDLELELLEIKLMIMGVE